LMKLQHKVAFVTGAGSGIGRSTALLLAQQGAKILVADVNEGGGQETVKQIKGQGGEASFFYCDVRNRANIAAAMDSAIYQYGSLDIVMNNAGILMEEEQAFHSDNEYPELHIVDINLKAVIYGTHLAIQRMKKNKGNEKGVIINTSSMAGFIPMLNSPIYCATKAAVNQFTLSCSRIVATNGLRINAIAPSFTDTNFTRKTGKLEEMAQMLGGKVLQPEDVAQGVLELCLDKQNGSILTITTQKGREYYKPKHQPSRL